MFFKMYNEKVESAILKRSPAEVSKTQSIPCSVSSMHTRVGRVDWRLTVQSNPCDIPQAKIPRRLPTPTSYSADEQPDIRGCFLLGCNRISGLKRHARSRPADR